MNEEILKEIKEAIVDYEQVSGESVDTVNNLCFYGMCALFKDDKEAYDLIHSYEPTPMYFDLGKGKIKVLLEKLMAEFKED